MMRVDELMNELEKASDIQKGVFSKSNRIGCVGNDFFIGIKVKDIRKAAIRYSDIAFNEIEQLLDSDVHEHRMCALIILKSQFLKGNEQNRKDIFDFYLRHTERINDWDLVDSTAPRIVGEYLYDKPCDILYRLAESNLLWDNRIAIMATYTFIHKGNVEDTFRLAVKLMKNPHVLVQKAVGWMLHEAGKYDPVWLNIFVENYHSEMPRVMLRIAISWFSKEKRKELIKIQDNRI